MTLINRVVTINTPLTDGNLPIYSGAGDTFVATTSTSISGWQTAFDINFATQTSQNLNTAGNYNIGGYTWKAEPNSFGRGDTQIVNGQGLVIQCINGGSGYGTIVGNTDVKNAPLLWLPLSQLNINGLDYDTAFRIWVYVTNQTMGSPASATGLFFGIDNDVTQGQANTNWFAMVGARDQANATQTRINTQLGFADWTSSSSLSAANIPGHSSWTASISTSRLDIPCLVPGLKADIGMAMYYGPAYSSGWPTQIPWAQWPIGTPGSGTTGYIGYVNPNGTSLGSTLGIVIGAANTDAFTLASTTTVARMRVDYRI